MKESSVPFEPFDILYMVNIPKMKLHVAFLKILFNVHIS